MHMLSNIYLYIFLTHNIKTGTVRKSDKDGQNEMSVKMRRGKE